MPRALAFVVVLLAPTALAVEQCAPMTTSLLTASRIGVGPPTIPKIPVITTTAFSFVQPALGRIDAGCALFAKSYIANGYTDLCMYLPTGEHAIGFPGSNGLPYRPTVGNSCPSVGDPQYYVPSYTLTNASVNPTCDSIARATTPLGVRGVSAVYTVNTYYKNRLTIDANSVSVADLYPPPVSGGTTQLEAKSIQSFCFLGASPVDAMTMPGYWELTFGAAAPAGSTVASVVKYCLRVYGNGFAAWRRATNTSAALTGTCGVNDVLSEPVPWMFTDGGAADPAATAAPTPSSSVSPSASLSNRPTPSGTLTPSVLPSAAGTPSGTPSTAASATGTRTVSGSATLSASPSTTGSLTRTASGTQTATRTGTGSATPSGSAAATPSASPSNHASADPAASAAASASSALIARSSASTPSPSGMGAASQAASASASGSNGASASGTPTASASTAAAATGSPSGTSFPAVSQGSTPTQSPAAAGGQGSASSSPAARDAAASATTTPQAAGVSASPPMTPNRLSVSSAATPSLTPKPRVRVGITLTVSALSLQQVLASPGGLASLHAVLEQLQLYLAATMLPRVSSGTATTPGNGSNTAAALGVSLSYVRDRRTGAVLAVNDTHAVNAGLVSGGSTGSSSGSTTSGGAAVAAARLLQAAAGSDGLELGVAVALQPASDAPLPAASDVQTQVQTAMQAPAAATYLQAGSVITAAAVGVSPTSVSATVSAVSAQAPSTPADTSNTGTSGASTGAGGSGGGANVGAVAGGIVVAIAVVGVAVAAALYVRRGRGDKRKSVLTASSRKSLSHSGAVIITEPDTGSSSSNGGSRASGARKYSIMTSTANPLAGVAGPGNAQAAGGRLPSSRGVSAFEPTHSREYERV